jgi:hypothetical protein
MFSGKRFAVTLGKDHEVYAGFGDSAEMATELVIGYRRDQEGRAHLGM